VSRRAEGKSITANISARTALVKIEIRKGGGRAPERFSSQSVARGVKNPRDRGTG
jgi:hypothetical protein